MTNRSFTRIPSAFSSSSQSNVIPVLFQVLSPDNETLLLPDFLYLHVNPSNFDVDYNKVIERFQTMGGFVEQHFGEELASISASQSTGAFISVQDGVTLYNRQNTIAYRKMLQLEELFKSNGSVYDDSGQVRFKGRIRIVFDHGTYDGYFDDFSISESNEQPFNLDLSWSFTVEREAYQLVY